MPAIELLEHSLMTPRVSRFVFQAPFRHEAGQYVALSAPVGGTPQTRYYSIASPPDPSGKIELCAQHDGAFGSHLRSLRRGDRMECSEPGGTMRLLDAARPAVYFAAGTGVSPMRAILLAQLAVNPAAEAILLLGARHSSELLFRDEFEALAARNAGFRFLPSVSGDDGGWDGRRGRVAAHVDEAMAGLSSPDAYFCGQREMVAQLRKVLTEAGIPDERQVYERY
ncbi:MAG: FAD-dependent oxidoreductase [Bryobacterales bacterium]|nr:FAD-dependent oxidoreductase [Bryobacterales bacterium]MDE0623353.1 FAD-dependent oxidoreductase [Bryobacterales bacterium]